jgi:tetratricopeptide (TPR) repeat protein
MIRDKLALAMAHHQAGRMTAAERLYREILAFDSGHADSLNLLGVMADQLGHHEAAAALIDQAIACRGSDARYHFNLGRALKSQGRREAASSSFARALVLQPDYAEAHDHLGKLCREAGRLDEAIAHFTQALAFRPDLAEVNSDLGGILEGRGQYEEAAACYRRALRGRPDFVSALYGLASVLRATSVYEEAEAHYRRVLALQPDHFEAGNGLGLVLARQGRADEAASRYRRVLEARPDYAEAHYNLALVLEVQGEWAAAIAEYRLALRSAPDYCEAHNKLGLALQAEGHFAQAAACYERALAGRPEDAGIHNNLGMALQSLGRPVAALACYRRALALGPDDARVHANLATCLLLMGALRQGFEALSESRHALPTLPLWGGESLAGRSILIHCERGLGDNLQFIRYVPLLAGQARRVGVLAPSALVDLFRSTPGVEIGETMPDAADFDCHVPMLCLPRLFGTELATIPAAIPYLSARPEKRRHWAARLAPGRQRMRIGLLWDGASPTENPPAGAIDRRPSLDLGALASLGSIDGMQYIGLQRGTPPAGLDLVDAGELNDFADMAGLVANLDLLVSVDGPVAHLAGALGKPVWLLVSFDGNWRWLLDRDSSPWYPTMRLFRQPAPGDWDSVVRAVRQALLERGTDPQKPPLAATHPDVL